MGFCTLSGCSDPHPRTDRPCGGRGPSPPEPGRKRSAGSMICDRARRDAPFHLRLPHRDADPGSPANRDWGPASISLARASVPRECTRVGCGVRPVRGRAAADRKSISLPFRGRVSRWKAGRSVCCARSERHVWTSCTKSYHAKNRVTLCAAKLRRSAWTAGPPALGGRPFIVADRSAGRLPLQGGALCFGLLMATRPLQWC